MTEQGLAIEIDRLGVRFDNRWVLRGFDLHMYPGEKVTLTGLSGSGKSTVLKCVLGLVIPQEGSIGVFGRPVNGHSVWEVRRHLAYVAQEPDLGSGTARQAIGRPFAYKVNAGLRGNLERLPGLMRRFSLSQALLDKEISTLSGGEKQRVALISAILLARPVILLDEASSALDKTNKEAVADYFERAGDLTVLSVSHDTEWLGFSTRVVDMDQCDSGASGVCESRSTG